MAIAFDNSADGLGVGGAGATALSWNHVINNGTNGMLFVRVSVRTSTDVITSVTCDGVAMDRLAVVYSTYYQYNAYLYAIKGQTAGTKSIVVSLSSVKTLYGESESWINVNQSTTPDAIGSADVVSGTLSLSLTVIASGCWLIAGRQGGFGTWSGVTERQSNSVSFSGLADSDGPVSSGSNNVQYSSVGAIIVASFAPSASTSAALTGTALGGISETDIVAGGKTIIVTLTGDTFVPA